MPEVAITPARRFRRVGRRFMAAAVGLSVVHAAALGPGERVAASSAHESGPGTTSVVAPTRVTTPVLSVRRAPEFLTGAIADRRLLAVAEDIRAQVPETSCIAIADGDREIARINGTTPVIPASLQKVLTATALLDRVGSDTVLTTRVLARRAPVDGVVDGDVWVVGAGDPILTTPGYQQSFENPGQVWSDFTRLADAIEAAGVTRITGNLVGDDSRYDQERYFRGWPERFRRQDQVGPLSALLVNDGVTGYATSPDRPTGSRRPGDPPVLAVETLATLLDRRGIVVEGVPAAGRAPEEGTVELATLPSLPLRELTGEMLADSDNTTSEVLLKELAVRTGTVPGSTTAGAQQILEVLRARNLPLDGVVLHDGSGLDEDNRVTCDLIMGLLEQLGPSSDVAQGFAVAGQKGTLRKRLVGTPAEGRILAKTGTLNTVFSLAGFATDTEGGVLTFSVILNGSIPNGPALLDELAVAMATYPDRPDPALVSPEPARP